MRRAAENGSGGVRTVSWRLERGARVGADGGVTFSVWAPRPRGVSLQIVRPGGSGAGETPAHEVPMQRDDAGVWSVHVDPGRAGPGADYRYLLDGVGARPDPVSRHQPA